MRRIASKARKGGSHPTRVRLIEAASELMQDFVPEAITTDMVLAKSGISKGSLYHHFEDLADLIETVLINQFSQMVDENAEFLRESIENAANPTEVMARMRLLTQTLQSADRRGARMNRARLIVFSHDNPRLSKKLAAEQSRLTSAYVDTIKLGIERGFIRQDVDPLALAVFIQSYTLGKLIDDIANDHVSEDAWVNLIMGVTAESFVVKPS
ncbi:MAG: TetR/AcrR family transcriptional regulator [Chakrabartia sp.]